MSVDLEWMGHLARHIGKRARMRHPQPTIPQELHGIVAEMGRIGVDLAGRCAEIIEGKDAEAARYLEDEDDAIDHLHHALLDALLCAERPYKIETAVDVTLIGRHYERFADHAVSVARRVVFLVTGDDLRIS